MSKLGIYVHIPFCKSKCKYCDFYSLPCFADEEQYLKKLKEEIAFYSGKLSHTKVDTVYFGGGTPTCLKSSALADIFEELSKAFQIDKDAEITVEANPDTVTSDKIKELSLFANRVSVGVQSLDDEVLRFAGRIHDAKVALNAIDSLVGKFRLSADIMLGLPLSNVQKSVNTARKLIDSGVKHLSCYGLKVEESTPFYKLLESNAFTLDEDKIADEYDAVSDVCKANGLKRYEVSNFAVLGEECRHNLRYWKREDYLGLGVSAHSFVDGKRFYNPANITGYLSADFNNFSVEEEVLDEKSAQEEEIMLAFRTSAGINFADFYNKFGVDFNQEYASAIKKNTPYLEIKDGSIRIKEEYFYAMNSIIVEFLG